MKQQVPVTNQVLYNYHVELQQLHKSVLGMLFRSKINEFYKDNLLRINLIEQGIVRIQKEHLVFEGDQIQHSDETENGQKIPLFLIGKTNEDLQKAYKELMEKQITITV